MRHCATSALATADCLLMIVALCAFFSAHSCWVLRGPPPCARQVWRERCFAAADQPVDVADRDTPPLGRVLQGNLRFPCGTP